MWPLRNIAATSMASITENSAVNPTTPCGTPSGWRSRSSVGASLPGSRTGLYGSWPTSGGRMIGCSESIASPPGSSLDAALPGPARVGDQAIDRQEDHRAEHRREQAGTLAERVPAQRVTERAGHERA